MPLIAPVLKAKFQTTIYNALKKEFTSSAAKGDSYTPEADANWLKIANAVSEIAVDIVNALQQDAMVAPGIPVATAGSPAAQAGATTAPGKIL